MTFRLKLAKCQQTLKLFDTNIFRSVVKVGVKPGILTAVASCITGIGNPLEVGLGLIVCSGALIATSYALGFHHGRFNLYQLSGPCQFSPFIRKQFLA